MIPDSGPLGLIPTISISRANCPGALCSLTAIVATPGSLVVPRTAGQARYDLAATAVAAMQGAGAASYPDDTTVLLGATYSIANPVAGNPGAVVAVAGFLNTASYHLFVRINDTRDPALLGDLSAVGNLLIQGTTILKGDATLEQALGVTGAVTVGSTIAATGTITSIGSVGAGTAAGCSLAEMLANGQIISRSDCAATPATLSTIDPATGTLTLAANGVTRVTATSTGTANVSVRSATNLLRTRITDTGVLETYDATGAVVNASMDGTAGRGTMRVVNITTTGSVGAACVTGNDVVLDSTGTGSIVTCIGGFWRSSTLLSGTAGAACVTAGALAQDGAGIGLICRGGTWQNINDRVSRSVAMARYLVTDQTVIPKPVCPAGTTAAVVIISSESGADYANSPPRNRFTASAVDMGVASWTAIMRLSDGTGAAFATSFGGAAYNFQGIATTFCDFGS